MNVVIDITLCEKSIRNARLDFIIFKEERVGFIDSSLHAFKIFNLVIVNASVCMSKKAIQ